VVRHACSMSEKQSLVLTKWHRVSLVSVKV
jgi:hypothetical protein